MTPIPFMPNGPAILALAGYTCTHIPAHWEEDGDCENGPSITGHDAYDEWMRGDHMIIVANGFIVDAMDLPPDYWDPAGQPT